MNDNVRKVFDLLGVEPNEEFKIEDKNCFWKIDEKLNEQEVKDRFEKDSSNCHIVLLAKNDNGRKKINRAIYESFNSGYYYKNRMDLDILLSLPKDDIFVTTACIAFWNKYVIGEDLPFGNREDNIDYKAGIILSKKISLILF